MRLLVWEHRADKFFGESVGLLDHFMIILLKEVSTVSGTAIAESVFRVSYIKCIQTATCTVNTLRHCQSVSTYVLHFSLKELETFLVNHKMI